LSGKHGLDVGAPVEIRQNPPALLSHTQLFENRNYIFSRSRLSVTVHLKFRDDMTRIEPARLPDLRFK